MLKANETADFQCDCMYQGMTGSFELDPATWAVNCSTSFAIRNSKKPIVVSCVCVLVIQMLLLIVWVETVLRQLLKAKF